MAKIKQPLTDTLFEMLGETGQREWLTIVTQLEERNLFKAEDRYMLFAFCSTLEEIEKYSRSIPSLEGDLAKIKEGADLSKSDIRNEIKFYRDQVNFAIDKRSDAISKFIQLSAKLGLNPKDRKQMKIVDKSEQDGFEDFLNKK